MNKLNPFENGEKICFIGDSITAANLWISYIADYYSKSTDIKIEIYPCGISGGRCESAIKYFHEQTTVWEPTTAVIMLGMNDINRLNYSGDCTEEKLRLQEQSLQVYKKKLTELSEMLKKVNVKRIIYLAPTPYDEEQICETENLMGCQNALRKCAEIMKKVSEKFVGEFLDFGGIIYDLMHQSYLNGSKNQIICEDRVHPNNLGHSVMARAFLSSQGFSDMNVTAEQICDGTAELYLSDKGEAFQNIAHTVQRRWTAEFQVAQSSPDKSIEGKIKYMDKYLTNPEEYGEFFVNLAMDYEKLVKEDNRNKEILVNVVKDLFR